MNTQKIKEFFDEKIPPLKFHLKAQPVVDVNVATVNNAQRLIAGFSDFVHPEVYNFIEYLGSTEPEDFTEEVKEIINRKSFIKFLFYLTVYCGQLKLMLDMHCYNYLPKIGVAISKIVNIEYFPHIIDKRAEENPYATMFEGDTKKLIVFCNNLEASYMRVNLEDDFMDISATDILGYVDAVEEQAS